MSLVNSILEKYKLQTSGEVIHPYPDEPYPFVTTMERTTLKHFIDAESERFHVQWYNRSGGKNLKRNALFVDKFGPHCQPVERTASDNFVMYQDQLGAKRGRKTELTMNERSSGTSSSAVVFLALPEDLPLLRFDYYHRDSVDDSSDKVAKLDRKGRPITTFYEDVEAYLQALTPVMAAQGLDTSAWKWRANVEPLLIKLFDGASRALHYSQLLQAMRLKKGRSIVDYMERYYELARKAGTESANQAGHQAITTLIANRATHSMFIGEFARMADPPLSQLKFYEDVEAFLYDLKPLMARAGITLDDAWQQIIDAALTKAYHLSQWREEVNSTRTIHYQQLLDNMKLKPGMFIDEYLDRYARCYARKAGRFNSAEDPKQASRNPSI
ncbi:hypothetical protein BC940DRAFT_366396 [Gongronella butleri]|nr:hypothetical protein BC940DRAFT_366396 [Gongronella butleri]